MRPPKISLVTALSVFLLFSCLLGSATGLVRQQHPGRPRVVRGNHFIEARQPDGEPAYGYGPPPPYYTGEPAIPSETALYSTLEEAATTTGIKTGSSGASMTSGMHASSGNYKISHGTSSVSMSSEFDTNTVVPSAASSAKAATTTSSEASTAMSTTASTSPHVAESSGDETLTNSNDQISTRWVNDTSFTSAPSSAATDNTSDSTSIPGTTMTIETLSRADSASSLQVPGTSTVTDQTSSNIETESVSETVGVTSLEESSSAKASTTTTTRVLNTTVTFTDVSGSTRRAQPSTTYLTSTQGSSSSDVSDLTSAIPSSALSISSGQTTSSIVVSGQNSSRVSNQGLPTTTVSEVSPIWSSIASGSVRTVTSETTVTEVSGSESMQATSLFTGMTLNGTAIVTTTTYLTPNLDTSTLPSGFSNSSGVSTSHRLPGVGTEEPSKTVATITSTSSIITTKEGSATLGSAPSVTDPSVFFTSTSTLSRSHQGNESDAVTIPIQTSSDDLVASSALPINATLLNNYHLAFQLFNDCWRVFLYPGDEPVVQLVHIDTTRITNSPIYLGSSFNLVHEPVVFDHYYTHDSA
ncbi:hypothetical protein ACLX1H_008601 [Fusarium chlamydosporum]